MSDVPRQREGDQETPWWVTAVTAAADAVERNQATLTIDERTALVAAGRRILAAATTSDTLPQGEARELIEAFAAACAAGGYAAGQVLQTNRAGVRGIGLLAAAELAAIAVALPRRPDRS